MSSRLTTFAVAALGTVLLPACNPYQNFNGEYYAGPIDPTNFAAPYVGVLAGTADQQGGVIAAKSAFVAGAPTIYYLFPMPDSQLAPPDAMTPATPLTLDSANLSPPLAYVFDPTATSAFPSPSKCKAPNNYIFDQRTEAYRKDEQGVIFTKLPTAGDYVPIVQEIAVSSNGEKCQDIKSKAAMTAKRQDVTVPKNGDGKYLAFAIVDPGADVQPNGADGLGPIHLGFYNHYLVGIIDGGYIPTVDIPASGMDMAHTDLRTQKIYAPSMIPVTMTDDMGVMTTTAGMGGIGKGFDILEAARGDAAYSPVCEVWSYDADVDAMGIPVPETDVTALTQAEMASAKATGDLVYCFQVF